MFLKVQIKSWSDYYYSKSKNAKNDKSRKCLNKRNILSYIDIKVVVINNLND